MKGKALVILAFSVLSLITLIIGGELRFCYYGPHRIRYEDCPGGFIAKVPIVPTCTYYHKAAGAPNMKVSVSSDVCDYKSYRRMQSGADLPNNPIQLIRFYDVGKNATPGDDSRPDLCNETCLPDYVDMTMYRQFNLSFDKPPNFNDMDETQTERNADITRWIMLKETLEEFAEEGDVEKALKETNDLLKIDSIANLKPRLNWSGTVDIMVENHDIRKTPMSSILKLFGQVLRVTYKHCQPFVEPLMLTMVFRFFQELRKLSHYFLNMDPVAMNRILDILQKCETGENDNFELRGHSCPQHDATRIYNKKKRFEMNFAQHSGSWDSGNRDFIVDIGWSAVQFVHGHCFQYFQDDVVHFSLMVRALSDFFMDNFIRDYWLYTPFHRIKVDAYMGYFQTTADQLVVFHDNLDACVMGAYENSVFKNRLEKPYWFTDVVDMNQWIHVLPYAVKRKAQGWKSSTGAYWKKYEKTLFLQMMENLGICYKSKEEFAESGTALIKRLCENND